jgi:SAM-dependent methyltransferase
MSLTMAYDQFAHWCYQVTRAWLAPEVRNSQFDFAERLRAALRGSGRWLDLGCGHDFLPAWMPAEVRAIDTSQWSVTGLDMDARAIALHRGLRHRIVGNGEMLPFAGGSFDLITANMVVEHVADPSRLFSEMARVLAPGGQILLHTPNVAGYTTVLTRALPDRALVPLAHWLLAREAEDVYPTYYRANSTSDLAALAQGHGLVLEVCDLLNSSPQTVKLPPLMVCELLFMRATRWSRMAKFRACLLAMMHKPSAEQPAAAT